MKKDISAGKTILTGANWWKLDLGDKRYIEEIEIDWTNDHSCKYIIELSLDAVNWVRLSDKQELLKTSSVSDIAIKTGTRFIRITIAGSLTDKIEDIIKKVSVYSGRQEAFISGVDVSHLPQIEDFGGKYFNRRGEQQDCLTIMKEHGVNYIRLKVWNKPGLPNSDPAGYNDKKHVLEMSKRVSDMGFKLLIDFHYSDWWADPGKQFMPEDWKGLSFKELNSELYAFTYDVLSSLKAQGTIPELVQIGNEITNGMMWDVAKTSEEFDTPEQWDKLCTLLKTGICAAKDTCESVKTIIHIERGGDNERSRYFYDRLQERNVEFDMIGLSFYPVWHGTVSDFSNNIRDLYDRYKKEIVVAETAYPFTTEDGDDQPNATTFPFTKIPEEYPPSIQSQANMLQAIIYELKNLPDNKGTGFFYWQPDFIPVRGAGWKYGEGCEWDDQAMFDFKGNALWSLDIFKMHS